MCMTSLLNNIDVILLTANVRLAAAWHAITNASHNFQLHVFDYDYMHLHMNWHHRLLSIQLCITVLRLKLGLRWCALSFWAVVGSLLCCWIHRIIAGRSYVRPANTGLSDFASALNSTKKGRCISHAVIKQLHSCRCATNVDLCQVTGTKQDITDFCWACLV